MPLVVAVESAGGENCWVDCHPDPAYILVDEDSGEMLSSQAYPTREDAEEALENYGKSGD